MTWLSRQLVEKQKRQMQIAEQQLFLLKQSQQHNRKNIKANFTRFTLSQKGLLTFTVSGVFYELAQSNAAERSKRPSLSSIQRWLILVDKLQLL